MENDDRRGGGDRPGKQEAGAMVVAPEPEAIAVRIDMAMLHCPICFLPLKPPIFQCDAGHMACSNCRGKVAGGRCHSCEVVGVGYARSRAMEAFVSSTKIQCPYEAHGCRSYVAYYAVDDHQRACPHAPCSCPEPGCGFAGSPPALLDHLSAAHSCNADKVEYGKALCLRVPASERRRLLVGEEDKRVFLLAVAAVGAASAVTLVRVAASAETAARYRCKMWANAPAPAAVAGAVSGKADMVMVDMEVASSGAAPGGVAVEEAAFLAVPPRMLHGQHKEIILGICIDKKTS